MKLINNKTNKSMQALKKPTLAALIPLLLSSAMTMSVSTNAVAGSGYNSRELQGLECRLLDGRWSRKRSGIYVCAWGYGQYTVYNFYKRTQRMCGNHGSPSGGCITRPMWKPKDKEEKPQSDK